MKKQFARIDTIYKEFLCLIHSYVCVLMAVKSLGGH